MTDVPDPPGTGRPVAAFESDDQSDFKARLTFRLELEALINMHSRENGSNTPDFILAQYLVACLDAFDVAVRLRSTWYGHDDSLGSLEEAP